MKISVLFAIAVMATGFCVAEPILIRNSKRPGISTIEAERIAVGVAGDYKACLAVAPSGELFVVAFHQYHLPAKKYYEDMLLFRSRDGGKSWSKPQSIGTVGTGTVPYHPQ